jgi:hypothetical protein
MQRKTGKQPCHPPFRASPPSDETLKIYELRRLLLLGIYDILKEMPENPTQAEFSGNPHFQNNIRWYPGEYDPAKQNPCHSDLNLTRGGAIVRQWLFDPNVSQFDWLFGAEHLHPRLLVSGSERIYDLALCQICRPWQYHSEIRPDPDSQRTSFSPLRSALHLEERIADRLRVVIAHRCPAIGHDRTAHDL